MRAIVFAFTVLLLPSSAWADKWDDCETENNPDLAIRGCTRIINNVRETAKNRALALFYRGLAHSDKNEYDASIADYTEALELNPAHA